MFRERMNLFSLFCFLFLFLFLFSFAFVDSHQDRYENLYHPGYTHPDSPFNYAPVRPIQSIHAIAVLHSNYGVEGTIHLEQDYYQGAPVKITGKITGLQASTTNVQRVPAPPSVSPEDYYGQSSLNPGVKPPSFQQFTHRDAPSLQFTDNQLYREYDPQPVGPLKVFPSYFGQEYDPRPVGGRLAPESAEEGHTEVSSGSIYKSSLESSKIDEVSKEKPDLVSPTGESFTQSKIRLAEDQEEEYTGQTLHAIHIHQYGDLSDGCESTGEHFNPDWTPHGGPNNYLRHVGDLGNIFSRDEFWIEDSHVSLFGRNSIIGRSIVIHELPDDYGKGENQASRKNGNAGLRVACGIIAKKDIVYHQVS